MTWELRGVDLSGMRPPEAVAVTTQTVVTGRDDGHGYNGVRCYARTGSMESGRWLQQVIVDSLVPTVHIERAIGRPDGMLVGMREPGPREDGALLRIGRKDAEILMQLGVSTSGDDRSASLPDASQTAVTADFMSTDRWLDPFALETVFGLLAMEGEGSARRVPSAMAAIRLHEPMPPSGVWCHAIRTSSTPEMVFDLKVVSDEGLLLVEIDGLTYGEAQDMADEVGNGVSKLDDPRTEHPPTAQIP
ncbi:hypothetical protein [Streptomyces sp. NPDC059076]|uniref:hypothetical protein n=1 Tax=unclassified Streptomyces TaxID=2593676 RepID=UPI0036C7E8F2